MFRSNIRNVQNVQLMLSARIATLNVAPVIIVFNYLIIDIG